jgi:hypothetical protein
MLAHTGNSANTEKEKNTRTHGMYFLGDYALDAAAH